MTQDLQIRPQQTQVGNDLNQYVNQRSQAAAYEDDPQPIIVRTALDEMVHRDRHQNEAIAVVAKKRHGSVRRKYNTATWREDGSGRKPQAPGSPKAAWIFAWWKAARDPATPGWRAGRLLHSACVCQTRAAECADGRRSTAPWLWRSVSRSARRCESASAHRARWRINVARPFFVDRVRWHHLGGTLLDPPFASHTREQ